MIEIKITSCRTGRKLDHMGHILFRCPRTGLNVQHWLADEVGQDQTQCSYETVACKACTRLHFINRSTGGLLGEEVRPAHGL